MNVRTCTVSFADRRGVRHSVEVEAESLYEAAVLGVRRLNQDPWLERIDHATVLTVDVHGPTVSHAISLERLERWLGGAAISPSESMKKAKLKMLLMKG